MNDINHFYPYFLCNTFTLTFRYYLSLVEGEIFELCFGLFLGLALGLCLGLFFPNFCVGDGFF
jgi:hypothetical protein